ncbi:MAG: TIGR01777 family oxidoreductase [Flavobacteriales bacterium]|nr:TIGR01777 family oxidoreductase [Flavobacteriales bacterium]
MTEKVLISGGTGLLGSRLTEILIKKGYHVAHLSRSKNKSTAIETIVWDVNQMQLDPKSIEKYDYIIHLAGAGIVDEAWTEKRKKTIIDSRVNSTNLLKQAIAVNQKKPKAFVAASAIGFYGIITSEHIYTENDQAGKDFLASTCELWEQSSEELKGFGFPISKIRIGLVLSKHGGALKEIAKPVKFGLGAALGSGKQYMSWIHIDDLCQLFIYCFENQKSAVFNGVAPNQMNNKEFTKTLAKVLGKPFFLPNVPSFVLKLILGDRAQLVLEGSRISAEKVKKDGFAYQFEDLETALKDIYKAN